MSLEKEIFADYQAQKRAKALVDFVEYWAKTYNYHKPITRKEAAAIAKKLITEANK